MHPAARSAVALVLQGGLSVRRSCALHWALLGALFIECCSFCLSVHVPFPRPPLLFMGRHHVGLIHSPALTPTADCHRLGRQSTRVC